MIPIRPGEIREILAVTDALGLHREAIVIPLAREGPGALALRPGGKVEITAPAEGDWNAWLAALPAALTALDLARVQRVDPDEE